MPALRKAIRSKATRRYKRKIVKTVQAYRTKRVRRNPMTSRSLVLSGFPTSKVVRLRYVTQTALDSNPLTLPIATVVYRANDMFDPEVALGGHQPMGFDQWMALYDHFTVIGSKISVKFINNTNGARVPGLCGIMLNDTTRIGQGNSITTLEQLLENRYRTGVTLGNIAGDMRQTVTKTMRFSSRRFFRKKAIVGDDLYRGSRTSSPQEDAVFEVFYTTIGSNDPTVINLLVTIEYIAVLTEPVALQQS